MPSRTQDVGPRIPITRDAPSGARGLVSAGIVAPDHPRDSTKIRFRRPTGWLNVSNAPCNGRLPLPPASSVCGEDSFAEERTSTFYDRQTLSTCQPCCIFLKHAGFHPFSRHGVPTHKRLSNGWSCFETRRARHTTTFSGGKGKGKCVLSGKEGF